MGDINEMSPRETFNRALTRGAMVAGIYRFDDTEKLANDRDRWR